MEPWVIGKALSPFFMLFLVLVVTAPARRAIERRMREGWLKRLLLRRVGT